MTLPAVYAELLPRLRFADFSGEPCFITDEEWERLKAELPAACDKDDYLSFTMEPSKAWLHLLGVPLSKDDEKAAEQERSASEADLDHRIWWER